LPGFLGWSLLCWGLLRCGLLCRSLLRYGLLCRSLLRCGLLRRSLLLSLLLSLLPKVYLSSLVWWCSCRPQLSSLQPCRRSFAPVLLFFAADTLTAFFADFFTAAFFAGAFFATAFFTAAFFGFLGCRFLGWAAFLPLPSSPEPSLQRLSSLPSWPAPSLRSAHRFKATTTTSMIPASMMLCDALFFFIFEFDVLCWIAFGGCCVIAEVTASVHPYFFCHAFCLQRFCAV
jgi:hypothetical protein